MVVLPIETLHDIITSKKKRRALSDGVVFATAGDKGVIRVWSSLNSDPLTSLQGEGENQDHQSYSHLLYRDGRLVGVASDHTITIYDSQNLLNESKQVRNVLLSRTSNFCLDCLISKLKSAFCSS